LAVKPSARGRTSYNTNNQQPTTISVLEFPETGNPNPDTAFT